MNLGGGYVEGDIKVTESRGGGRHHISLYTYAALSRIRKHF